MARVSREGIPPSKDRGHAALVLLVNDCDQCLRHSKGTLVKADKGHFTLLIKTTFVIETKHLVCNSFSFYYHYLIFACEVLRCPLDGDKLSNCCTLTDHKLELVWTECTLVDD